MNTNIHFLITSRSVLLRMKKVSDKCCRENQNMHFTFRNFFPKTGPLMRLCGEIQYSQTSHDNRGGGKNLQFACHVTKTRKQTSTNNIEYLLLFYGKKGYTNTPQCYVMCTLRILFLILATIVGLKLKTLLHTGQLGAWW